MSRRILLASAGALALTGAAFAADLPKTAPPPVYLPPPPPMWTGFYMGVNAGGTWSNSNSVNVVTTNVSNSPLLTPFGLSFPQLAALGLSRSISLNSSGFIGGGQIGYNYQFGPSFVAGIEADIQGIAGSRRSASLFSVLTRPDGVSTVQSNLSASKSTEYIGTVRGRLGFLMTPTFLVYGTGGLAYGGTRSSVFLFSTGAPNTIFTDFVGFGSQSSTRVGWTAGGGAEWMFLPNWSVKAEYLYYDLGSVTYQNGTLVSNIGPAGPFASLLSSQTRVRYNGNIVRAGINYHFNWMPAPVVAKY